ncbi:unnamed protein product, partial [Polarella glacialis]
MAASGQPIATFCGAVDAAAAVVPDLPAVVEDRSGASLSYGQLSDLSKRAAHGLLRAGVVSRCRRPVATCMRRGCDWYVVYVASSRLGTPLAGLSTDLRTDPSAAARRNRQLMEELEPQLLVLDVDAADNAPGEEEEAFGKLPPLGSCRLQDLLQVGIE